MRTGFVAVLLATLPAVGAAQNYRVGWQVSGIGGGRMASTSYGAGTTAGQTAVGNTGSTSFLAIIGFWQGEFQVGVSENEAGPMPLGPRTGLGTVSPNPVSGSVRIRYSVAVPTRAVLRVYDLSGRAVRSLVDDDVAPGEYSAVWDRTDESGRAAANGVYFCRFEAGEHLESCKLVVEHR